MGLTSENPGSHRHTSGEGDSVRSVVKVNGMGEHECSQDTVILYEPCGFFIQPGLQRRRAVIDADPPGGSNSSDILNVSIFCRLMNVLSVLLSPLGYMNWMLDLCASSA